MILRGGHPFLRVQGFCRSLSSHRHRDCTTATPKINFFQSSSSAGAPILTLQVRRPKLAGRLKEDALQCAEQSALLALCAWGCYTSKHCNLGHDHRRKIPLSGNMSQSHRILTLLQEKGNATEVDSNPQGASFKATFPSDKQFTPTPNGNIRGVVLAQSGRDGKGVRYDIMIDNLPKEGGPFGRSKAKSSRRQAGRRRLTYLS